MLSEEYFIIFCNNLFFKFIDTFQIWNQTYSRIIPTAIQPIALRKLLIHRAKELKDLLIPPANKLEKLRGNRKEQYSIRINSQWRICFNWKDNNAYDVEIIDYH